MRPLRAYLLALVVGAVIPLLALATAQTMEGAARQRAAIETGLIDTSRALATSVEHEIQRSVAALTVLAASPRLARGDIAEFYKEARDTQAQMPWSAVWLADAQGQQLANLLVPLGTRLPSLADRPYVAEALHGAHAAVSDLLVGRVSGQPNVTVVVPRMQGGRVVYLVGAALRPSNFNDILASVNQRLRSATASVVGRDFVVIARNRDAERWVGQRAHESYIESMSAASEGLARVETMDGQPVYTAYRRLPRSGWTVGMGVLASEVEGPLRRALWINALIGLLTLMLAGIVATFLSRRITMPIKQLAATAQGIALGHPGPPPRPTRIAEIATLARALHSAQTATAERDQLAEQARSITAELEAVEMRERQQISRDLHDDLSQTLSAAQIRLARLQMHGDAAVARIAAEVSDLIARADGSTRSLAQQLSPPVLYELGLVPALEWLAQQFEQDYRLYVRVEDDRLPKPLSIEASSVVFRCARELLINVAKHAQTRAASLSLRVERGRELVVVVEDAGQGIDTAGMARDARRRLGLRGVKERLAHLGGTFDIVRLAGDGTRASMRVPLDAPARSAGGPPAGVQAGNRSGSAS